MGIVTAVRHGERRQMAEKVCGTCGKDILVRLRDSNKTNYCSPACSATGTANGNWKGGISYDKTAYYRKARELPDERKKVNARNYINNEIKKGTVISQPCLVCKQKAEAHHLSYDDPTYIVWLCLAHHRELHNYIRKEC
jgi:ribosomal protein L37AE/L43A